MSIADYWLAIIAAGGISFIAGAVIWMIMPWHKSDFSRTGDEEAVRSALKGSAPGMYNVPHVLDNADYKRPEVQDKFREGPLAFITILPSGLPAMGSRLAMMFVLNLVVAALCAYFLTMMHTETYLETYRVTCTVAWTAYGVAYLQESIWFGRPWSMTIKNLLDALIYGLLIGGVFGWLA